MLKLQMIVIAAFALLAFPQWTFAQEENSVRSDVSSYENYPGSIRASFSFTSSVGAINTGSTNFDNLPEASELSAKFVTFTPQFGMEFKDKWVSSTYVALPLYWDSSSDTSSSRALGRPEIGVGKNILDGDQLSVDAELAVRLPIYDDSSGFYPDGNRIYQLSPALLGDLRLGRSRFHIVSTARLSYDSKAKVALPIDEDTKSTGLQKAIALRTAVGVEYDSRLFTVGVSLKATDSLGSGKVTDENSVLREASPLDLMAAELSGSYTIQPKTKVSLAVTRGIKTRSDFYALAQQDAPEELADATMSLGLTQAF